MNDELNRKVGRRLRQLRERSGMNRFQLSKESGVGYNTLMDLEADRHRIQVPTAKALAHALGVTYRELFEESRDLLPEFPCWLREDAILPCRAYPEDPGLELFCPTTTLAPRHGSVVIDTGVRIEIPGDHVGLIVSRHDISARHDLVSDGIVLPAAPGTIRLKLYNLGDTSYLIERGDAVGTLLFVPVSAPRMLECEGQP